MSHISPSTVAAALRKEAGTHCVGVRLPSQPSRCPCAQPYWRSAAALAVQRRVVCEEQHGSLVLSCFISHLFSHFLLCSVRQPALHCELLSPSPLIEERRCAGTHIYTQDTHTSTHVCEDAGASIAQPRLATTRTRGLLCGGCRRLPTPSTGSRQRCLSHRTRCKRCRTPDATTRVAASAVHLSTWQSSYHAPHPSRGVVLQSERCSGSAEPSRTRCLVPTPTAPHRPCFIERRWWWRWCGFLRGPKRIGATRVRSSRTCSSNSSSSYTDKSW